MYIYAKLIEPDKVLCSLQVSDEYLKEGAIQQLNYVDKGGGHVDVDVRVLYTSGLSIKETHLSVFKKVTEHFYVEGEHVRHFFFMKGASRLRWNAESQTSENEIGVIRRSFLNGSEGGGKSELRGENEIRHVSMVMSKHFFLHLLENENWSVNDSFVQRVINGEPDGMPDELFPMSLPILRILHDLLETSDMAATNRKYYIELKLRELFFMLHEQQLLSHGLLAKNPQLYKTLENVKAHLVMNFNNPPTIKKLARLFLLNEKKLMHDFKATYGITIYTFIIQLRMERAKKMLLEDYSVNEMAAELGYHSVSHFIKTFKSYYGRTPKEALTDISKLTS